MTVKKPSAADKRFAALKAFGDKYRPESNGYRLIDSATPDDMIADIEAMKSLGRTDRWKGTLGTWQGMIAEYPNDRKYVDWAALQGGIYAAYAAD